MLEIKLLGKIKIKYLNVDISEQLSTKAIAILSLLLLNYPRDMEREKIISYLWPDSSLETGKYNLRYNLWNLKKIIGKDERLNDFLKINRNHCGINKNYNFSSDIISINEIKELRRASIKNLEFIREKFKGDFLEGFYFKNCDNYNELIIQERAYFENRNIKILLRLVDLYDDEGEVENCEKILDELSKLDPYDEKIALKNMKYFEKIGKRSSAILFYNSFKNRLITSLSIEPSPELEKIYSDLIIRKNPEVFLEKNKKIKDKIQIKLLYGISVKYFGISEILRILIKVKNIDLSSYLTKEEEIILGTISSYLLDEIVTFNISDIKVLVSFENLLYRLNKDMMVSVILVDNLELDKFSIKVLKYLSNKGLIEIKY